DGVYDRARAVAAIVPRRESSARMRRRGRLSISFPYVISSESFAGLTIRVDEEYSYDVFCARNRIDRHTRRPHHRILRITAVWCRTRRTALPRSGHVGRHRASPLDR